MAQIKWDEEGQHLYHTGVSKGVLFPFDTATNRYGQGVPWNGLKTVTETPEGDENSDVYADNIKYLTLRSAPSFKFTIEAYTYPDEFAICDGTAQLVKGVNLGQQPRTSFAFSYCSKLGNDTKGDAFGELLHIIYGASAAPSERAYNTVSDSPEAISFSWECSTIPVQIDGFQPVSIVTIDSSKIDAAKYKKLTDKLYGVAAAGGSTAIPTLVMPSELRALLQ